MFHRIAAALLVLLVLPAVCLAAYVPYETQLFDSTLPTALYPLIPVGSRIRCGAMIRHNANAIESDEPMSYPSVAALVLTEDNTGLRLLAFSQVDGGPWQVNDFTHLLREEAPSSITIYQPGEYRIPQFSVNYGAEGQQISDLMQFRGNRLWQLSGHMDESAGVVIEVGLGTVKVRGDEGRFDGLSLEYFWMEYMPDLSAFPTSRKDAEALDAATLAQLHASEADGLCYTAGANLRQAPTANAPSLGLYNTSVPVCLTGAQSEGTSYPWLEVRIGNTTGWMSANYVYELPSQYYPVPLGRTVSGCALFAAPDDAQPVTHLGPGVTFHILTEHEGMYHICIPRNPLSWEPERDGLYGYIPTDCVLTGPSPSALDALVHTP